MASDKSLYHKVALTLEASAADEYSHSSELESAILARRSVSFSSLQYDKKRDEFVSRPSKPSVHRAVRFCIRLGLVGANGRLTPVGRKASARSQFDAVVAQQVLAVVRDAGASASDIDRAIQLELARKPPTMPTAGILWEALQPKLTRGEFARLLTLLTHCGRAKAFQKRIYLSVGS